MVAMDPVLEARLRQSRQRWWLRQLVASGMWGWGAAAVLAVVQLLAVRLNLVDMGFMWLPLGVGVGVFGLHLVWSGRRAPSLQRLAQLADREFDLHEQLSTAREYQPHHQGLAAEVWRLQRNQAASLIDRLDPRRLVPLSWPPLTRWAVLCSFLAVGLYLWPGLTPRGEAAQNPAAMGANPGLVTQLEALEEVVRNDAERRNDPVLQATVQSLRQLRQDAAQNRLTPDQLDQQVALVTRRVEQNYGLAAAAPPADPTGSATAPTPNPSAAQSTEAPSRATPAEERAAETPAAAAADQAAQKIEETVNRLQQQSAGSSKPDPSSGKTPPPQKAQSSCGNNCQEEQPTDQYSAGAKQEAERRAMEAARRPPGGDPGGYGNEAGQGSPSQTASASKPLPPKEATTTVKVSTRPANTGSRIKIAAPPSPTLVAQVSAEVGQVSFAQQTEEPMPVQPVEPRNRTVVARYFAPAEENP
jgi:hypothetical protein